MAHESFEDEEAARQLNQTFICIKVDREERPDVDAVYMEACQMLHGSGGWPLTVLLTPERKPFFAATYLPKHSRFGQWGIMELAEEVRRMWCKERGRVIATGDELAAFLKKEGEESEGGKEGAPVCRKHLLQTAGLLWKRFDPLWGGFGRAPKFPMGHTLWFLLRLARQEDACIRRAAGASERENALMAKKALYMAEHTLKQMYQGGIYDHVGGGFSRYATDERWRIPHFEKMLYDNSLLAIAYIEAYEITKRGLYRCVAERTLGYMMTELGGACGGFYCGQDADSDGEEGKYYTFTRQEIFSVLGAERAEDFCRYYGVTEAGNFEGKNILYIDDSRTNDAITGAEGAAAHAAGDARPKTGADEEVTETGEESSARPKIGADEETAETGAESSARPKIGADEEMADAPKALLQESREALYSYRKQRCVLHRDEKILAAWNGMALAALSRAWRVLQTPGYLQAAQKLAGFLTEVMTGAQGRLFLRWKDNDLAVDGQLADYACCAWGLLELYAATWDAAWLKEAVRLAELIEELFSDPEKGGYFLYSSESEQLISRPKEIYDGAMPSGNSVTALVLIRLWHLTGREHFRRAAQRQLCFMAGRSAGSSAEESDFTSCTFAAAAAIEEVYPSWQLICVAAEEIPQRLRKKLLQLSSEGGTILVKTCHNESSLAQLVPATVNYPIPEQEVMFYYCRQGTCHAPTDSWEQLMELMGPQGGRK